MPPRLFQMLVLGSMLTTFISITIDYMLPQLIPASLTQAEEAISEPAILQNWWGIAVILLWPFCYLGSMIGMLFFRKWARSMAFWTTLVSFLILPFLSVTVSSGLGAALDSAASTMCGAALALAYFGPIRGRFESQAAN